MTPDAVIPDAVIPDAVALTSDAPSPAAPDHPRPVFLWDGDCGFCADSTALLSRHLSAVPDVQPWQAVDLRRLGLTETQVSAAVQWVGTDGAVRSGADAVAAWMTVSRQPWRGLGRFISRPLPGLCAAAVYDRIRRNRNRLPSPTWSGLLSWARGLRGGGSARSCGLPATPRR